MADRGRFLGQDDLRIAHTSTLLAVALRGHGRAVEAEPFQDWAMAVANAALTMGDQEGGEVLAYLQQPREKAIKRVGIPGPAQSSPSSSKRSSSMPK